MAVLRHHRQQTAPTPTLEFAGWIFRDARDNGLNANQNAQNHGTVQILDFQGNGVVRPLVNIFNDFHLS